MTPTPAELAAALETVRDTAYGRTYVRRTADGEQRSYLDDCELLARWLAENAGRLRVETACEECLGDGCEECNHIGLVYAPAFPEVEGRK